MTYHRPRPCPCGSGQLSHWQFDARGIELCRTCPACHQEKMARYRPEVLVDPAYDADEAIDPDEPTEWEIDEEDDR